LYLADVRLVTADLLRFCVSKGVVLLPGFGRDDRLPLAGSTNTNEAALIRAIPEESSVPEARNVGHSKKNKMRSLSRI
jgi:hypothetical protein